jgi:hypothetical protein
MKSIRLVLGAALPVCAVFLFAACESKPDRRAPHETARNDVPPMAASETFFAGQIAVNLTLGNVAIEGGRGGDDTGGGRHGKGGGHHGGGRHGGSEGESSRGGAEGESGRSGDEAPAIHASNLPPVMLRLRLENTGSSAVVVEVRDLDSELGDFAIRPDRLVLEPGQSVEPDPMESLLGLDTYALPVTITLRAGGKTETKVLTLRPVTPAPTATPAPAAPPPTPPE